MIKGYKWIKAALLGVFIGTSIFTLHISNAVSYLSDDPEACINCHVMAPEYASWEHSSHRGKAVCNDCHVPHDNIVRKMIFKAQDGIGHASAFTFRWEPQVIKIKDAGREVVLQNCKRCHINQMNNVSIADIGLSEAMQGKGHLCWDCHREIPHGRVHSQSSVPHIISIEY